MSARACAPAASSDATPAPSLGRRILVAYLAGAGLMAAMLAITAAPEPPRAAVPAPAPVAVASADTVGSLLAHQRERAAVFGSGLAAILRSLDAPELAAALRDPATLAADGQARRLVDEAMALGERAAEAPARLGRLLDHEREDVVRRLGELGIVPENARHKAALDAHDRRARRLAEDLQPGFDARLDLALALADLLQYVDDNRAALVEARRTRNSQAQSARLAALSAAVVQRQQRLREAIVAEPSAAHRFVEYFSSAFDPQPS